MLNSSQTTAYTDFNSLGALKIEAKNKTPEAIKEVAKQFESVFIGMVMKSMRQAKLADGIFDSSQSDFYRDMYDQQLSVELAGEGGIGLADLIEKQLGPNPSSDVINQQKISDYQRQRLIRPIVNKSSLDLSQAKTQKIKIKSIETPILSAADFINQLRPYAEKAAKQLGVNANILMAQSALETGWGQSVIQSSQGISSHNLFNIKADKSWHGQQQQVATLEFKDGIAKKEMAGFRSYASYQESFNDYVQFIKSNPRYHQALKVVNTPEQYMHELQKAGYATDPQYADKVIRIYQSNILNDKQDRSVVMNPASPDLAGSSGDKS